MGAAVCVTRQTDTCIIAPVAFWSVLMEASPNTCLRHVGVSDYSPNGIDGDIGYSEDFYLKAVSKVNVQQLARISVQHEVGGVAIPQAQ